MKNFVSIYRYIHIDQDKPYSVQRFEENQCVESQQFKTYTEAMRFADSFGLEIVDQVEAIPIAEGFANTLS